MTCVLKAEMLPRRSRINGVVDAISVRDVGIEIVFSASHVNDVGIRRSKCQRPNGRDRFFIENWLPHCAAVSCLPDASAIRPEIIDTGISRHTGHGVHLSGAKWPDHSPFHFGIERFWNLLCAVDYSHRKSRGPQDRKSEKEDSKHR